MLPPLVRAFRVTIFRRFRNVRRRASLGASRVAVVALLVDGVETQVPALEGPEERILIEVGLRPHVALQTNKRLAGVAIMVVEIIAKLLLGLRRLPGHQGIELRPRLLDHRSLVLQLANAED